MAGKPVGNLQGMTRGSLHEFCVSAVHGYAGNFLFYAQVLVAFTAEIAFAAGPVHPRNANAVADFQVIDRGALFYHATRDFVPENQGFLGDGNDLRPIAIGHVQIRVADATRFHLDQHFVGVWFRLSDLFDRQWPFEFAQDGCFHCVYLDELGMRDSGLCGRATNFCDFATTEKGSPLRLGTAQEKFDRISHPLSEFMGSGKIDGPLADDGIEKPFHEFG